MADELKREFTTIGEAFAALPLKQQEHAERVAEYLKVMFLQACSLELYAFNHKAAVRLKEDYVELIPIMGRYHDIGKALVPEEYHSYRAVFSPEEAALYRKHAMDSAQLARHLLDCEKRFSVRELNYITEGIMDHHERWDGEGFPDGRRGENSSIFARLLAVANALDHFATEKHSEQPLEFAFAKINEGAGTLYDPLVVEMLGGIKGKIRRIFNSHIAQSRAIPVLDTFVRRSNSRPFELWYRPIMAYKKDNPAAFEAVIRFRDKRDWMDYDNVAELLRREKMGPELGVYMMLEACDTLNRLDACGIPADFIALELPTLWLNRRGAWRDVQQVLTDTAVAPQRLCIDLGARTMNGAAATMQENLKKLRELGCRILLSDFAPETFTAEAAKSLSVTTLRLTTEQLEGDFAEQTVETLLALTKDGVEIMAQDIVKKRHQTTLNKLKTRYVSGTLAGELRREDELVERELAAQEGEQTPVDIPAPIREPEFEQEPEFETGEEEPEEAAPVEE